MSDTPSRRLSRRLLLGGIAASPLVPAMPGALIAQTAGGEGGRGPGSDPAQVLPGPFGPLGGPVGDIPGGDGSKENLEEASESTGDIGETLNTVGQGIAGVGGAVAGIGAATGIGAGIGGGISLVGMVVMGIGQIFNVVSTTLGNLADDPPRADYKQEPYCLKMPSPVFNVSAMGGTIPRPLQGHADDVAAFLTETANALAALEYWQGAYAARDREWMKRHRAPFVRHFNAMRQAGITASQSGIVVERALARQIKASGLTMPQIRAHAAKNAGALEAWAASEQDRLLGDLASQCGEIGIAAALPGNRGREIPLRTLTSRYKQMGQSMQALPLYG